MNIFYLDPDPETCASLHCDKHCVKMILEYAQLLSTAHHVLDGDLARPGLYAKTHVNHPSAVWVRQSIQHYVYVFRLLDHLCAEYSSRYGRTHKTEATVMESVKYLPQNLRDRGWTEPPQCMPDEYKCDDPVDAYQQYYRGDKARFAVWKDRVQPPTFMY
jgi:hypothetical protein